MSEKFKAYIKYGYTTQELNDPSLFEEIQNTGLGFIGIPDLIDFRNERIKYDSEWYDKSYFELMEFTGMYDKTGKPIYEGDIVEAWSEGRKARGEIKRRIDGLWLMFPAWQNGMTWSLAPDEDGHTTVLIVGNIYEGYHDE